MSIELRPLGVACNLACHYCYQNPQRDAGNQRVTYDLEKMKAAATRLGGRFTLFGGEPLLMRFKDLEHLFAWGLEKQGGSSIQTNGALIESRHIDLFRKYKVDVGVSIDGPGELNDVRWDRNLERTRKSTAQVEDAIARLCMEYKAPGIIITLHKGNATADKLPAMMEWVCRLDAMGIKSVRLHLLEVDHDNVRDSLALSAGENIEALLAFAKTAEGLKGIRFDLFQEMENLLEGRDGHASCVWRACDPYTTQAVQGVEGSGQSSNCGRTNKDGVDFIKAETPGFERYVALYETPQSENGCAGCRFFLMCKGQCPGTAINGDWRNRTEHCPEWMHLFRVIEKRVIQAGRIPLTLQPIRLELERRTVEAWKAGGNPSINRVWSLLNQELVAAANPAAAGSKPAAPVVNRLRKPGPRVSWVSDKARELWHDRLDQIRTMLENMTVFAATSNRCAVRRIPKANLHRLTEKAALLGLGATTLPLEALPGAICTRPNETRSVIFMTGPADVVYKARAAWENGDMDTFYSLLELPASCLQHSRGIEPEASIESMISNVIPDNMETEYIPVTVTSHPLLAHLGLSVLPVMPCSVDCTESQDAAEQFLQLAAIQGYEAEVTWLRECMTWAISWSELNGVTEIKTPVFKMCVSSGNYDRNRTILREGMAKVQCGASGLGFPFAAPKKKAKAVKIII